ncbi:MAG TPA: lipid II flippase MurJ [Micromonosporaceae bacterium]
MTDAARVERGGLIVRATAVTVGLTVLGALLGLARDLLLARIFGATSQTDAFLVAWTVPETASPLLIEGAMAFLMVPIFVRALAERGSLRPAVRATLPRIGLLLVLAGGLVVALAPVLVHVLAPGLAEPGLAVTCTRVTALTVVAFGVAGYFGAGLRCAHRFGWAASIYVAYNVGILGGMLLLHGRLGVLAAAIGIALGALLMVAVQAPTFLRLVRRPAADQAMMTRVALGAFIPIAVFTVTRQAQVWVERFLGSDLSAGTISHLNYAQKVAQMPMMLSVLLATVTYPMLARAVLAGDRSGSRERTDADLRAVSVVVLAATAYLIAFAGPLIEIVFEHGAFTTQDTAATASIMRVYSVGLIGQAVVAVISRTYYSDGRPGWFPAVAMGIGLAVTAAASVALVPVWQAAGIAAGNALGIITAAVLLGHGLRRRIDLSLRSFGAELARLGAAASGAGLVGWLVCRAMADLPAALPATVGLLVVVVVFLLLGLLVRAREIQKLGRLLIGWCHAS